MSLKPENRVSTSAAARASAPAPATQDAAAKPPKPKKVKLSKAERKRLKHLAAIELKQRLMREQLIRELELTKKSAKRGKPVWMGLCAEVKIKEFREEIEEWGEKVELILEKKDEKIEMLVKTLEETQELHERNFTKHLDQLEYLSKCHQAFCESATALYDMQATEIIVDFQNELKDIESVQERVKENVENIMHSTNIVAKDRLTKNYERYMVTKFDVVSSEVEKRYSLRDGTVKKMKNLQNQLLLWMKNLQGDLVDVRKTEKFLNFMQRQRNYVKESNKLNEVEQLSRRTIMESQQELLSIESDSNRKLYGLKLEQAYFLGVRSIIKNSIERDKKATHEKLLAVASESHRVVNKLKEIVENGEHLLNLTVCCRKYTTEKEKVLPPSDGPHVLDAESDFMFKMQFDLVKLLDISEEELTDQMGLLKYFWRRCSNVRFHNLLLMEEKRKLHEENEKYRNVIRSMKKSDNAEYILESMDVKQLSTAQ